MTRHKTPDVQNGVSRTRRDLVEGHKGLSSSSSSYVVGELDTSRRGEDGDWIQEIRRSAILIRTASRCDHCETVRAHGAEFRRLSGICDAAVTTANNAYRALHEQVAGTGSAAA